MNYVNSKVNYVNNVNYVNYVRDAALTLALHDVMQRLRNLSSPEGKKQSTR